MLYLCWTTTTLTRGGYCRGKGRESQRLTNHTQTQPEDRVNKIRKALNDPGVDVGRVCVWSFGGRLIEKSVAAVGKFCSLQTFKEFCVPRGNNGREREPPGWVPTSTKTSENAFPLQRGKSTVTTESSVQNSVQGDRTRGEEAGTSPRGPGLTA